MDYFVFDDIDTRDYEDIYVFPSKVDDTPKRVYETKNIVGRDGALYIDQGRYEDVAQTYSIAALTKQVGSEFINALASKVGYFRLADSFNPTEFYSAVFTSGAEVKIEKEREKNVFSITFTRKPQRWLTSGETAVAVSSGDTITNPTLYEAKPLLKIVGYGDLLFNNYKINVSQANTLGYYKVMENVNLTPHIPIHIDSALTNTGDTINLNNATFSITLVDVLGTKFDSVGNVSSQVEVDVNTRGVIGIRYTFGDISHTAGNTEYFSYSGSFNVYAYDENNTLQGAKIVFSTHLDYISSDNGKLELTGVGWRTEEITGVPLLNLDLVEGNAVVSIEEISVNSSVLLSTTELNIDMDIGEAYFVISNYIIKANKFVSLGADLPKLQSGNNLFTYDNTITSLSVVPRWWKV